VPDPEPTPGDVQVDAPPREPVGDPTFGIKVDRAPDDVPALHRLVVVGDSLSHGFKSLAVSDVELSYPAMIANALGWREFKAPSYAGPGGVPLSLEWVLRRLEARFGDKIAGLVETAEAFGFTRKLLDEHEDYWERGEGARVPRWPWINHNLSVYGWDLRDVLSRNADKIRESLVEPGDDPLMQLPENADQIAALRVLDSARNVMGEALTPLEAAAHLGEAGGIETLIVWVGCNNALPCVLNLNVKWTRDKDYAHPVEKNRYTVWRPTHFAAELELVAAEVRKVRAGHVLWGTVPHVTIAPLARGYGDRDPQSAYFPYYARPWLDEDTFLASPRRYPHFTGAEALAVDRAIDQYNVAICDHVKAARADGYDWRVVDLSGVLDRLAYRRYVDVPTARPDWWEEYPLPPEFQQELGFKPDTRFLRSGRRGVSQGGLVSLDGVHPTTIAYGIVAHEFIKVMSAAKVPFEAPIDFTSVARSDTLCKSPLASLENTLETLRRLDDRFALIGRFERALRFLRP
jgi:hypothetical protein